ncbi:DUF2975 domain-containing protein [Kordia jejudonensis]|uniref:DUF2975 domain-containing protein n=1 Tax=Kordia jejudonensis TaxID=1348245 RepID=UPI000629B399|nr:DUF2975 domain-containing protein [Kordia jejudonensis]
MNSTAKNILKIMRLLAWIAFIGLLIKAGAIIMSYGISTNNPEAAKDLYKGMDLSRYEAYNFVQYTIIVMYYVIMYLMQAYIALFGAKLLSSINIEKPFSAEVVQLLHKISYTILGVGILAILHNVHVGIINANAGIEAELIAGEFIFLAGLVYVLAQLFKKGAVMQAENDLTV